MIRKEIKKFTFSSGDYSNIECSVPMTLYSILLDSGYIEEPFFEKNVSLAKSKAVSEGVFSAFFELSKTEASKKHIYLRLSGITAKAEVFFNGKWMELGGAGIFRPEVLAPFGVKYPVLAWGFGFERLAMLKWNIKDIRDLYISDLDNLKGNTVF